MDARRLTPITTRTAMHEQQRDCARLGAPDVHVVHVERPVAVDGDVARELGEVRVKSGLLLAPVEPAAPVRDKALDEFERRFGVEGLCNVKLGVTDERRDTIPAEWTARPSEAGGPCSTVV